MLNCHFSTMVSSTQFATTFVITLFFFLLQTGFYSATFTILNNCSYTVWPGISSGAGSSLLSTADFSVQPSESNTIAVPSVWSGCLWGRTLCSQDSPCVTGNCAFSTVECTRSNATPLATLAEFNLNGAGGLDFFDVSLVNGYSLPMTVDPQGGNCTCPRANVDGTRNFTCASASADYLFIFCPTPSPRSVELGSEKYPTSVNNSEGQVDGSTNNSIAVALVVASIICGLLACKITFFCSKRNCGIHAVAETRSEITVPGGPQSVTV